jgi:hypothetical protein
VLPFTRGQFFEVFALYNMASWPAAVAAYPLALVALLAICYRAPRSSRWAGVILAIMWAWVGIFYHAIHFSQVNPAAPAFAAAFLVQSLLFLSVAAAGRGLEFGATGRARGWAGGLMIFYAMAAYPLIGLAAGERYPAMPLFGTAPCPLLIFTFGILVLASRASWWLWIVPLAWSVVGGSAALLLAAPQDWALPAAAIAALFLRVAACSAEI